MHSLGPACGTVTANWNRTIKTGTRTLACTEEKKLDWTWTYNIKTLMEVLIQEVLSSLGYAE